MISPSSAFVSSRSTWETHPKIFLVLKTKVCTPRSSRHSPPSYEIALTDMAGTTRKQPTNRLDSEAKRSVGYGLHHFTLYRAVFS